MLALVRGCVGVWLGVWLGVWRIGAARVVGSGSGVAQGVAGAGCGRGDRGWGARGALTRGGLARVRGLAAGAGVAWASAVRARGRVCKSSRGVCCVCMWAWARVGTVAGFRVDTQKFYMAALEIMHSRHCSTLFATLLCSVCPHDP